MVATDVQTAVNGLMSERQWERGRLLEEQLQVGKAPGVSRFGRFLYASGQLLINMGHRLQCATDMPCVEELAPSGLG